jgi:hypothetical protein
MERGEAAILQSFSYEKIASEILLLILLYHWTTSFKFFKLSTIIPASARSLVLSKSLARWS